METSLIVIKDKDTTYISCSNCKKNLVKMYDMKTTNKEPIYNVQVSCCFCGDNSFVVPLYGVMKVLPSDGVSLSGSENLPGNVMKLLTVRR